MNIEYNVEIDDLVAFNLYYLNHSTHAQKQISNSIVFYADISFFLFAMGLVFVKNNLALSIILFALSSSFLLFAISVKPTSKKNIQKHVREINSNVKHNYAGKHVFSITPEYIKDIHESGEVIRHWDIIDNIDTTDQYLFIILKPGSSAFIVPKKAFNDDASFNQFVETAKEYHQSSINSLEAT